MIGTTEATGPWLAKAVVCPEVDPIAHHDRLDAFFERYERTKRSRRESRARGDGPSVSYPLGDESLLVVLNLSGKAQADFGLELGAWQKTADLSTLVGDASGASLAGSKLNLRGLKGAGVRIYQLNAAGAARLRGDFAG